MHLNDYNHAALFQDKCLLTLSIFKPIKNCFATLRYPKDPEGIPNLHGFELKSSVLVSSVYLDWGLPFQLLHDNSLI